MYIRSMITIVALVIYIIVCAILAYMPSNLHLTERELFVQYWYFYLPASIFIMLLVAWAKNE